MDKTLPCFDLVVQLVMHYLFIESNAGTLLEGLSKILQQAQILAMKDADLMEAEYALAPLPDSSA